MSLHPDQIVLLEVFVDGRLDGADLARAQELVRENADAAAWVRESAEADAAVRTLFMPPAQIDLAPVPLGVIKIAGGRPWLRWALAAGLLLAAAGAYITNFILVETPDSMYREIVAAGFVPQTKCTTDEEFADFGRTHVGVPFLVAGGAGVNVLGWSYGYEAVGENTVSLLADAGSDHIVVFADKLADDRHVRLRPFSGMHLFRREIGTAVFYEVSSQEEAKVLPLIYAAPERVPPASPGAVDPDQ